MKPQQVLESCLEEMNVRVGKHPTGALTLTCNGDTVLVMPVEGGWRLRREDTTGKVFTFSEIKEMVHLILKWTWVYGKKEK